MLAGPPLPVAGRHLWRWFKELSNARGATGFGPAPITYPDIQAWAALHRRTLEPREAVMLKALDAAYLTVMTEARRD